MLENRRRDSNYDSDDSDSSDATSDDSDTELGSPVAKRPWLNSSEPGSSRLAAAEAWRKTFQEGVIDSQLSRSIGYVSGGVPNLDRDTEAYNYKLAPRLPTKEARKAKRQADVDAISAAVAAGADEGSCSAEVADLEQFGLPSVAQPSTEAQLDLRLRLKAKNRKRNIGKRLAKQRRAAHDSAMAQPGGGGGDCGDRDAMDADRQGRRTKQGSQDKLDPSAPPDKLARRLAHLLQEPKRHLLDRIVSQLGASKAIELYRRTQDVESAGGMPIANGNRRRTPGGVYLQLMKADDSVTTDMLRAIFDGEANAAKDRRKRLRATRRRRHGTGRSDGTDPAMDLEAATEADELEKRRAELLAQLDALGEEV